MSCLLQQVRAAAHATKAVKSLSACRTAQVYGFSDHHNPVREYWLAGQVPEAGLSPEGVVHNVYCTSLC
jgi:hypothetical protein